MCECLGARMKTTYTYIYDNKSKILCHNKKNTCCVRLLSIFKCTQRAYFLCSHGYCGKVIQFNLISIFLRLSAGYMRSHKYTYNITYDVASREFFLFFNVYIHIFFLQKGKELKLLLLPIGVSCAHRSEASNLRGGKILCKGSLLAMFLRCTYTTTTVQLYIRIYVEGTYT